MVLNSELACGKFMHNEVVLLTNFTHKCFVMHKLVLYKRNVTAVFYNYPPTTLLFYTNFTAFMSILYYC